VSFFEEGTVYSNTFLRCPILLDLVPPLKTFAFNLLKLLLRCVEMIIADFEQLS
jgi:hypothetical protein